MLSTQVPVQPVRADDLSDAIAEQQRLSKLIADQKKQLSSLAAQQTNLKNQISSTRKNLTVVSKNLDDLQAEITALQGQVIEVKKTYDVLIEQQTALEGELERLRTEKTAVEAKLQERREILARRLVAAYKADQSSLLEQLLTAHSLTDVLSDVSYYLDLGAADKALADQIESDQRALAQIEQNVLMTRLATKELAEQAAAQKKQLDAQVTQLNGARAQLGILKRQMQEQLAAQQAAEQKLAKNKSELAATIRANGKALDDLGARIDKLVGEQGADGRIPSEYNGTLDWPMGGVITQEFGCTGYPAEPRVGSCAHFHQGIDLAAPCGTPIRASGPGVVVFVGYNPYDAPPKAWLVIIAHSTGLVTWYAHMTAQAPPGVRTGANVVAGQLIGWEGSTGHSTGCHLHWAARQNGVFVNPRLYL